MGDVLVSMTRPNLNAVAMVPKNLDGQIASTGFDVLRAQVIDPRWLFFIVRTTAFVERMSELVQGALYPAVKSKDIRGFRLPVAPLNEQKRIADKLAAILARVDACREHLDRIPAIIKRFRQAVLSAGISGKLTEEWRRERNRDLLNWESTTIGEVITGIEAGLNVKCIERPPESNELGLVKISAVTWGRYNDSESKTLPPGKEVPEASRIRINDFLISRANTLELVGACVIVDRVSRPVFLSDKILRLVMPDNMKPWVLSVLRSTVGRQQIENLASGNQLSMRNLSQASLRKIIIPLPPEDERGEIARRIENLFAYAESLEAHYRTSYYHVEHFIPALLAKAFRGELMPQDPNDEPASVFLERMRNSKTPEFTTKTKGKLVRMSKMKKLTKDSLKDIITQLPNDQFGFEELRESVGVDYDTLKDMVFSLLGETSPALTQVFDTKANVMRFVRVK